MNGELGVVLGGISPLNLAWLSLSVRQAWKPCSLSIFLHTGYSVEQCVCVPKPGPALSGGAISPNMSYIGGVTLKSTSGSVCYPNNGLAPAWPWTAG